MKFCFFYYYYLPSIRWVFRKRLRKRTMAQSTVSCCTAVTAGHDHVHFFPSSCQHAARSCSPTPATKDIYLSTLWRLRSQDAGSSFFLSPSLFSLLFSLLIEADLYQAPVALTPVAITRCAPLHRSGLSTAEWQPDNPLWNDLGPVSARPRSRWKLWRPKESRFPAAGRRLRPVNHPPVAC